MPCLRWLRCQPCYLYLFCLPCPSTSLNPWKLSSGVEFGCFPLLSNTWWRNYLEPWNILSILVILWTFADLTSLIFSWRPSKAATAWSEVSFPTAFPHIRRWPLWDCTRTAPPQQNSKCSKISTSCSYRPRQSVGSLSTPCPVPVQREVEIKWLWHSLQCRWLPNTLCHSWAPGAGLDGHKEVFGCNAWVRSIVTRKTPRLNWSKIQCVFFPKFTIISDCQLIKIKQRSNMPTARKLKLKLYVRMYVYLLK